VRLRLLMLSLMFLPLLAEAEINSNAGEYGFQFLQTTANPVAAALAGTGVYALNYPGAYIQNPAANLTGDNLYASAFHSRWLLDTNSTQLIYGKGSRQFHFGLAARMLDYGTIESRDETGLIIGEYHPLDANLLANFAYRLHPDHLVGINLGLLYEKLDASSCYGLSTDFGYIYLSPLVNTQLFATVRNLGYTTKMDRERIDLPLIWETGFNHGHTFGTQIVNGQLSVSKALDTNLHLNMGIEYKPLSELSLRAGYKYGYDEESFTTGIGIAVYDFQIDYAWVPNSDLLNDVHTFGLTYHF